MEVRLPIPHIHDIDLYGRKVLLRLDLNSPIHGEGKKIANTNRIEKSIPTIEYLLSQNAAVVIISHQGDSLDYHKVTSLQEHGDYLSRFLGKPVHFIDDVAGPAAREAIAHLSCGDILLLDNLRYLSEEISSFEDIVPLSIKEMLNSYLVRNLSPLFDVYINDAFSAAHRNAPSMVAFQHLLPTAAGLLFFQEFKALSIIKENKNRPIVYLLGGAKISDAFSVIEHVLETDSADTILTCGLTGIVFAIAQGHDLGEKTYSFLQLRSLHSFIDDAKICLHRFPTRILVPHDLAYSDGQQRKESFLSQLPSNCLFCDIGQSTIERYTRIIHDAATIFVNGPAGVFEDKKFEKGTRDLWKAVADSPAYSLIGGGDSVRAVALFSVDSSINYISTAGGAMLRYLAGKQIPLLKSLEDNLHSFHLPVS